MRWGQLIMAAGVALAIAGCEKAKVAEVPFEVTVAPATNGSVVAATKIIGQAKAYDSVNLEARVKGFLTKRLFREGQLVKKNDLLFEIEKDQYQADVESAQGQLLKAQAALKNAEIEFNRQAKLLKENATSQRNYDDVLCKKMEAQAGVMQAEAQLQNAKINLSYTDVRSPFDGRVGLATYSVGNVVGPGSEKLANVVSLNPIRILFNVSEVDVLNMRLQELNKDFTPPQDLIVRLEFQNGVMYKRTGVISFCNNKINESTGTLLVEALFENPEMILFPGMYVKVIIEEKKKVDALLIPQCAIQQDQAGSYVLVVDKQNKVSTKYIKTGITSGPCVQVISGLQAGELVVIDGLQKIHRDSVVKPVVDKTYTYGENALETMSSPKAVIDNGGNSIKAGPMTSNPITVPKPAPTAKPAATEQPASSKR